MSLLGLLDAPSLVIPAGQTLITPGSRPASVFVSRAQPSGAMATRPLSDGVTWEEVAADTARVVSGSMLSEPETVNRVRNPRAEGAVPGTPGTLPTHWQYPAAPVPAGLSADVVGVSRINGVDCLAVRVSGTATANGSFVLGFDTASEITASFNQWWTSSAFLALVVNSGVVPPQVRLSNREFLASGGVLEIDAGSPALSLSGVPTRFTRSRQTVSPTIERIQPTVRADGLLSGSTYDFVVFIGWPQMEQAAFATTPVLPAVGTPTASTRGADTFGSIPVTRSQPSGARATRLLSDGVTWEEVDADTARLHDVGQALLTEVGAINYIRNPRFVGLVPGVIGSGGAYGTNITGPSTAQGIAVEVLGQGVTDGIEWMEMRCQGTATAAWQFNFIFENNTNIAATAGQTVALSCWAQLVAGAWPFTVAVLAVAAHQGNTFLGAAVGPNEFATLNQWRRRTAILAPANAGLDNHRPRFSSNSGVLVGTVVDFNIRLGWPQHEFAGFATTPVLPAAGTVASATRGADVVASTLASLGIADNGRGTYLWRGRLSALATGPQQALMSVSDGTTNNEFRVFAQGGGIGLLAGRTTAGVNLNTPILGNLAAGAEVGAGITNDGAGNLRVTFNSEPVVPLAGAPSSGLNTFRAASAGGDTSVANGRHSRVRVLPGVVLSDYALRAAVAAL